MCKYFFKTLAFDFLHTRQASFSLEKRKLNELTKGVSSGPVLHTSVRIADVVILFPQFKGHDKDGSNKSSFKFRLANFTNWMLMISVQKWLLIFQI